MTFRFLTFLIILVFIIALGLFYWYYGCEDYYACWGGYNRAELSQLGDFIGGILNPILTFLTVLILLRALFLQQEELGKVTNQLELTTKVHEDTMALQERNNLLDRIESKTKDNEEQFFGLISREILVNDGNKDIPCTIADLMSSDSNLRDFSRSRGFKNPSIMQTLKPGSQRSNLNEKARPISEIDEKLNKAIKSIVEPFNHLSKLDAQPYQYIEVLEPMVAMLKKHVPKNLDLGSDKQVKVRDQLVGSLEELLNKANEWNS